jgi:hypothetical protein
MKEGGAELLSQLAGKFNLDADKGTEVLNTTTDSLQSDLLGEVTSGNFSGILALFNGESTGAASSLSDKFTGSLAQNLLNKVGIKNEIAIKVAQFIIPFIVEKISQKKPSGGFTASSITDMLKGSVGENLQDKAADLLKGGLGKLFG